MNSRMNILITGGAGFIGSNLARYLVRNGHRVVVLDNCLLGRMENLDGVDCVKVEGDVLDADLLKNLVEENKITGIFHLSGYSSAPMFDEGGESKNASDLRGFFNTLRLSADKNIKVVFASTSSFYARCEKPFLESMRVTAGTHYELSKLLMEQAATMFSLRYGIDVNGLRFFSVYGPHEKHKGRFANNISQFYWSIKNDVRPVIFGDGEQTRDFTYVGDLVEALLMVMEKGRGSEVYNVGTGEEHSFNEMIKMLNDGLGKKIEPIYAKNPLKNYVANTLADISKIKKDIGWQPSTSLAEGIKKVIDFDEKVTRDEALALYDWIK